MHFHLSNRGPVLAVSSPEGRLDTSSGYDVAPTWRAHLKQPQAEGPGPNKDTGERRRFILCMQPDEAAFFETLLAPAHNRWTRCVQTLGDLYETVSHIQGTARLIAFCSDLIVPGRIIEQLGGDCFNFHSGPPERPGYRPAAFAAAEGTSSYGVTFHRMLAEIDAGPIYATRRFQIRPGLSEEEISALAYGKLLWLATEVAVGLTNPGHRFQPTGEVWGARRTSKSDYRALGQNR